MKKITRILLLFISTLLVFYSCSPETVKEMPKEEVKETEEKITAIASGSTLEVRFAPVAFASEYAYSLSDGMIAEGMPKSYSDGYFIFNIDISGESAVTGSVTVYARSSSSSEWTSIGHAEYVTSLKGVPLDAYISKRESKSVEISVNTSIPADLLSYKVTVQDGNGGTTEKFFSDLSENKIEVNDLQPDMEYTITLMHALKNNDSEGRLDYDSNEKAVLYAGAYNQNLKASISLSVSGDGKSFIIENVPTGITTVDLYKRESANSAKEILIASYLKVSSDGESGSGTAEIPFSSLSSLESGYFHVKGIDSANEVYISNILKYTTPLILKGKRENYKSVYLDFDFASDVDLSSLEFSVAGAGGAYAEVEDDAVIIKGLTSNTDYSDSIRIKPENDEYSSVPSITLSGIRTKSYAGKSYEWNGKFTGSRSETNFRVYVTDSEEESEFPYYVYFSSDDASVIEQGLEDVELRISPLLDESAGEKGMPGAMGISVNSPASGSADANNAYVANSKKWNRMKSMSPARWYIKSCTVDGDDITTVTWTSLGENSAPSESYATTTIFSFIEYDVNGDGMMDPVIKFSNRGSTLVNLGLYTNSDSSEGEDYGDPSGDKYCFYLSERR